MIANLTPDIELAERLFAGLRRETFDGVGVTREAYGPGEQKGHDLARAEAEAIGLECHTDAGGNLLMTLPGADRAAPRVILGSVPQAGRQGAGRRGAGRQECSFLKKRTKKLLPVCAATTRERSGLRPARLFLKKKAKGFF